MNRWRRFLTLLHGIGACVFDSGPACWCGVNMDDGVEQKGNAPLPLPGPGPLQAFRGGGSCTWRTGTEPRWAMTKRSTMAPVWGFVYESWYLRCETSSGGGSAQKNGPQPIWHTIHPDHRGITSNREEERRGRATGRTAAASWGLRTSWET